MAPEEEQPEVDLATNYPEVVIQVGKITFGESQRKKISKNIRQKQKLKLARAVCALLNSGGGVVKAEIENEGYTLQGNSVGLDIETAFRDCIQSPDLTQYFNYMQQNNSFLIFVKSWSSKNSFDVSALIKPRICSLSSGLYLRSGTSVVSMKPGDALEFLKKKQAHTTRELKEESGPSAKKPQLHDVQGAKAAGVQEERDISNAAAQFFERDRLEHGETLNFTESTDVEFKDFATKNILHYLKDILPDYLSAFANTQGGYLIIGVNDNSIVVGCSNKDVNSDDLIETIDDARKKLTLCPGHIAREREHNLNYKHKIINVYSRCGDHYGYVCAVRIESFHGAVFSEAPDSWVVKGNHMERLSAEEWYTQMTAADPELSNFADAFKKELSLSDGPPLVKPVYSHQGADSLDDMQKYLFPVEPNRIKYTPENLSNEIASKHPGLINSMKEHTQLLSHGLLIFSRSWAVQVDLQENPYVVCDALLIAVDSPPILYTVFENPNSAGIFEYSRCTARRLKEKLVNVGGYTEKVCVRPKLLCLHGDSHKDQDGNMNVQCRYPTDYSRINSDNLQLLLRSLTIFLLSFPSFLSDQLGCEFFNLLTIRQYELLSKNLHVAKKLFVYGLPGTGKTIVALKIIEKIRNVFNCKPEEILYICENQPLKNFVSQKNICQSVTRVTFLKMNFEEVRHIVVDEAQNFRANDGAWFTKAKRITQRHSEPGVFWIFLDYLQISHPFATGLPPARQHDPVDSLTKVVRNAKDIYNIIKSQMEVIVRDKTLSHVPYQRLEKLLDKASCDHHLPGYTIRKDLNKNEMANYVARQCLRYLEKGYSEKEIAILCSTEKDKPDYEPILTREMRKFRLNIVFQTADEIQGKHIILDSIRRFSGLERSIVFGVNPVPSQEEISANLLLCVASRANLHLHLLFEKIPPSSRATHSSASPRPVVSNLFTPKITF
uniref:Schlafen family member 13 n=1 Tax=Pelodiscus sinensis TaxID=13735 RepID=K7G153_PELSI|nr:schlafen family member 13 [Pelodiscus sinensis]|eukprot:XP_006119672.1 schlafen family member 13 [Pelodiscus sinensis]